MGDVMLKQQSGQGLLQTLVKLQDPHTLQSHPVEADLLRCVCVCVGGGGGGGGGDQRGKIEKGEEEKQRARQLLLYM